MKTDVANPLTVGLVQINNNFSGQSYLPYSVGLLQAYAQRHATRPDRYRFLLPIYKRLPIAQIVDHLAESDVAGFSTYVWNGRVSLEAARRLKARSPNTLIVFGGPHVPDQPEEFLRANRFIDLVIHNEGERTFLALLESLPGDGWKRLPGISYLDADDNLVRMPPAERLRDLADIPSPFLSGVFKPLMDANPNETWIGLWETNRGCPFQCSYCDWGSATAAKVSQFDMERLRSEVAWFAEHRIEFIFCCDANFGILKRDVDIACHVAEVKSQTGYPKALSVQNTKNATERAYQTQKILADAGLNKGVALSMQTIDQNTLVNIRRDNISLETYLELQRRFTRDGVETYSDLILGLPGETYESFIEGLNTLIRSGQHNRIQFNNLSILPNAEMGSVEYQKKHGLDTVESRIINIHGRLEALGDDVPEVQMLVVATNSLPRDDWRRVRAVCWMTAFLYFDKILQLPMMVMHHLTGVSHRRMVETFMEIDAGHYPLLASIRDFFLEEARSIQNGGPEYVYSKDWLGIHWPADEYMLIKLTAEGALGRFYDEAGRVMETLAGEGGSSIEAIRDAVKLNHALLKQPFVSDDVVVETGYDVLAFHRETVRGHSATLEKQPTRTVVRRSDHIFDDFNEWCREVVWYGNKKGAYLYGNRSEHKELAGHY